MRRTFCPAICLGLAAVLTAAAPALAIDQVAREQDIVELRLGQKVQVDDGSCPTGQIKEIMGATLSSGGVTRVKKCVPKAGTKTR